MMGARFLTDLDAKLIDDIGGLWQLDNALVYYSDVMGKLVDVPAGFVTDFASVPRLPFVYLAEGGKGDKAAVIHDWLYSAQPCDRATADKVLREALLVSGYSELTANTFYAAVRVFGGSHWTAPNNPQPDHVQQQIDMP